MFFLRKPDSERGRDEQNGPPGMEPEGDIEVSSNPNFKSSKFPLACVQLTMNLRVISIIRCLTLFIYYSQIGVKLSKSLMIWA